MSFEDEHVAHPRLYGAPAYVRPPLRVAQTAPIDPDDLPIAVYQTDEEREIVESLRNRPFGLAPKSPEAAEPHLRPQRLSVAEGAGRLISRAS